jgi:hypothetical protein
MRRRVISVQVRAGRFVVISSSLLSAQHYRDRAAAMRQEAEWAESDTLKATYMGMAHEWDAMADKTERVEKRLKH